MIPDIKKGFAEVNGAKLYYEITGNGEPIVLIHGNGGDCRHWDNQFISFSKNHRVIRYDVRGFGKSSLPEIGIEYSHFDDQKELMKYHNIEKAHIIGTSMGAGLATDFVLAYPHMCLSDIAVGPWVFGFTTPEVEKMFSKVSSILESKGEKAALDYWCDKVFVYKHTGEIAKKISEDYHFWHYKNINPAVYLTPPAVEQLENIQVPTLIMVGEYDYPPCVEVGDLMEKQIPNNEKIIVRNADHGMAFDKSNDINQLILDFLERL